MLRSRFTLFVAGILFVPSLAWSQTSGAVFTTNKLGTVQNGNTYKKATYVYLNAGPCSGGLANGPYYFQVTDTSGKTLLSTDDLLERVVTITNGVITDAKDKSRLGKSPCGNPAKSVQLAPFGKSGNDEYKVWLTPVGAHSTGNGFHGFMANASKTDNFKVKNGKPQAQSIITGFKFYQVNMQPIAGWRVEIYKDNVLDGVTFTNDVGKYTFIREQDGTTVYRIREVAPGGFILDPTTQEPTNIPGAVWLAKSPGEGLVTVNADNVAGPNFINLRFVQAVGSEVGRSKGFWSNNNGKVEMAKCDSPEPVWRTEVNKFDFRHPVVSSDPSDPGESIYAVSLTDDFDTAFDTNSAYLVGNPTSGHTGYQLSREVLATLLNNTCGFMQGEIMVNRNRLGILVPLTTMFEGAKALLADPLAGLTGPHATDANVLALIVLMKACINEFGDMNTSETDVVHVPGPNSGSFTSPYEETVK